MCRSSEPTGKSPRSTVDGYLGNRACQPIRQFCGYRRPFVASGTTCVPPSSRIGSKNHAPRSRFSNPQTTRGRVSRTPAAAMNISAEIAPFYFGVPEKELFGCLHMPEADSSLNCGVVVCQPFGHEYVNSHRALRQLAVRLAGAGFPVLRFDYHGCGDSRGETTESSISEWISNISQAIF